MLTARRRDSNAPGPSAAPMPGPAATSGVSEVSEVSVPSVGPSAAAVETAGVETAAVETVTGANTPGPTTSHWLAPRILSYLMGPAALVVLLVLRHFHLVARVPVYLYFVVFTVVPATSTVIESYYRQNPSRLRLHMRMAFHTGSVTAVIYMTGWGPVVIGAYAFVALENIATSGSRTWRIAASWSFVGIAIGQLGIWQGWVPSFLSLAKAETLGLMGAFVLLFVIRMAGATSEQKEEAESSLRTSEERFRSLVQNSSDTTLVLGPSGVILYASPATRSLLGREPDELIGRRASELVHPDDRQWTEPKLAELLRTGDTIDPLQFRMHHRDGEWRFAEAVVTDMRDRSSVGGYVVNVRDITERKEAEDKLAHQALHDPLTGLPNRLLLVDRLRNAIARGARHDGPPPVVMFLDLDRFKLVNDSLGHGAGDELLASVAERLRAVVRSTDTLSRFGGDEFVILCEGMASQDAVMALAERAMMAIDEPFVINGERVPHRGEHRRGLRRRRRTQSRGVAGRRRLRHVPGQGAQRSGPGPALRPGHAGGGPSARAHRDGSGPGARAPRARRLLPTHRGDGHPSVGRRGGPLRWQHPTAASWRRRRSSTWPSRPA
jgi:diguanylate cyclase (GGDEF)-like protein/PAS domain S-box-containing protein